MAQPGTFHPINTTTLENVPPSYLLLALPVGVVAVPEVLLLAGAQRPAGLAVPPPLGPGQAGAVLAPRQAGHVGAAHLPVHTQPRDARVGASLLIVLPSLGAQLGHVRSSTRSRRDALVGLRHARVNTFCAALSKGAGGQTDGRTDGHALSCCTLTPSSFSPFRHTVYFGPADGGETTVTTACHSPVLHPRRPAQSPDAVLFKTGQLFRGMADSDCPCLPA